MPEIVRKQSYEIDDSRLTTFADIYRQWLILRLKLASTFANVIHDKLITLNIADGSDKEEKLGELKELTNIFLAIMGVRERWFYDFSKNTLANELGLILTPKRLRTVANIAPKFCSLFCLIML